MDEEDTPMDEAPKTQPEEPLPKDQDLIDFLNKMSDFQPIIPDAVTDHYLSKSGFECPDIRIKRLLSLAAQKFVADIAQDAYQYSKIRQGTNSKDKTVLTMDDLSAALTEYGINIKRQDYYN